MLYLVAFIAMFITDSLWTVYIRASAQEKPLAASLSGSLIYLSGALVTVEYIRDPWILLPAVLGGALGTYLTVAKGAPLWKR